MSVELFRILNAPITRYVVTDCASGVVVDLTAYARREQAIAHVGAALVSVLLVAFGGEL